jgi:predicted metal-dependent hydrolase
LAQSNTSPGSITTSRGARGKSPKRVFTPAFDTSEAARLLAERVPRKLPVFVRISNRAKGIVLRLQPGRGLEVVAPAGIGVALLCQAVDARREWIAAVCDRLAAEGGLPGQELRVPRPQRLVLSAFDRQWRLSYLAKDRGGCTISVRGPDALVVSGAVGDNAAVATALTGFCRTKGGELLRTALAEVSREAGLPYSGVSIRAQRTRWGSCTAKGRISLNFTLAFLPWELTRLVLLHELCHTVEMNHSHRFWALLERYVPGCLELDATLNTARHYLPLWLETASTDDPQ